VSREIMERIDALTARIAPTAPPGASYDRSDAVRALILEGLPLLEKRYGITAPTAQKGGKKTPRKA